jgi:streptogramin lyase
MTLLASSNGPTGEKPTPYALGFEAEHKVWHSSEWMDVIGRLNPKLGKGST